MNFRQERLHTDACMRDPMHALRRTHVNAQAHALKRERTHFHAHAQAAHIVRHEGKHRSAPTSAK
eukprot:336549-Chlamydomonas_euryale.AAC.1